jgi:hypothetical protein
MNTQSTHYREAGPSLSLTHLYISTALHLYISTSLHLYISTSLHLYISTSLHLYISTISTSLHLYFCTSLVLCRSMISSCPPYPIRPICVQVSNPSTCQTVQFLNFHFLEVFDQRFTHLKVWWVKLNSVANRTDAENQLNDFVQSV